MGERNFNWTEVMFWILFFGVLLWRFFYYKPNVVRAAAGANFSTWDNQYVGSCSEYLLPEEELIRIVRRAKATDKKVRVVGAGHSFNSGFATKDILVRLDKMKKILEVDLEAHTVTVEAGIRLKDLNKELAKRDLAMPMLGSISEQSVGGVVSTGTHGSGIKCGNISTLVTTIEIITSEEPYLVKATREDNPDMFRAACVSVGVLGIISRVTLKVERAFNMEWSERPGKLEDVVANLDTTLENNDFVKIWWLPGSDMAQLYTFNRTESAGTVRSAFFKHLFEAVQFGVFDIILYLLAVVSSLGYTEVAAKMVKKVISVSWKSKKFVDTSHRVYNIPGGVPIRHLELEYHLPLSRAKEVINAFKKVADEHKGALFVQEIRFVKEDDLFLSPEYKSSSISFTVMFYGRADGAHPGNRFFNDVEALFASDVEARPHWGKTHSLTAKDLRLRYENWDKFQAIRSQCDPSGVFTTPYIEKLFGKVQPVKDKTV